MAIYFGPWERHEFSWGSYSIRRGLDGESKCSAYLNHWLVPPKFGLSYSFPRSGRIIGHFEFDSIDEAQEAADQILRDKFGVVFLTKNQVEKLGVLL